jgi:hypothetical protein
LETPVRYLIAIEVRRVRGNTHRGIGRITTGPRTNERWWRRWTTRWWWSKLRTTRQECPD